MVPSFQTSPPEILQRVLTTIRSRFDYAHTALTCRAAFSAASDKALLRRRFLHYMQSQYFMLYDGHPEPVRGSAMEALDGAAAEALGYSFRNAMRLNELCDGLLFHESYFVESHFQFGFLPLAAIILAWSMIEEDLKNYKKLPVSDRRFVQRFLRTANKPCPFPAMDTLFLGEWSYDGECTFYTFDAVVRQPMGDVDIGDQLCLVVVESDNIKHQALKYPALDTFGRVFHGAVR
ncbi:hypothetical protein HK104_008783 [Borealophlyctis nickersoniae]|nr:hypothetical protein HK104_008783 [Borealophlyctis nickersoniae]